MLRYASHAIISLEYILDYVMRPLLRSFANQTLPSTLIVVGILFGTRTEIGGGAE